MVFGSAALAAATPGWLNGMRTTAAKRPVVWRMVSLCSDHSVCRFDACSTYIDRIESDGPVRRLYPFLLTVVHFALNSFGYKSRMPLAYQTATPTPAAAALSSI